MTDSEGFDTQAVLDAVSNTTNANLIGDLVGHPEGAPTERELEIRNPSLDREEIRQHLTTLQNVGVVKKFKGESGTFFRITDSGRELFDGHGIFPEEPYSRLYSKVEKSEEIDELEKLPRHG